MTGSSILSAGLAAACLFGVARSAQISTAQGNLRIAGETDGVSKTIVQASPPPDKQDLIICNAYAHNGSMIVTNLRSDYVLTQAHPLAYQSCRSFKPTLQEGDRLDFKSGNLSVGVFRATSLPKSADALMLIPHRRAISSQAVAFQSHAFDARVGPQIAVVDAYRGKEISKVRIMDVINDKASTPERAEDLRFNSVVSLAPGKYKVLLEGSDGKEVSSSMLSIADADAKYVVMRTGVGSDVKDKKSAFPQELVVFEHRSNAAAMGLSLLATLAIVFMNLMH